MRVDLKNIIFQIFGSENSLDYDIIVFVDSISSNKQISHDLITEYEYKLKHILFVENIYPIKPLNANLAVLKDGIIIDSFKGSSDEVNNFTMEHFYKVCAFQFAQTRLLYEGIEIYTKNEVIEYFPSLTNCICRSGIYESEKQSLQILLNELLKIAEDAIPYMDSLYE